MMTLFFNPDPVTDWDTAARSDTQRYAKYFWGMIDRGVYLPCSQFEVLFVSIAHSDEQIEATIAAAAEVLGEFYTANG
jgi:glutamate-1-semialdehyde 2,1-aminomutase